MSAKARAPGFLRDLAGATAVEFAVVLPVFALMLAGLAQVAWTQHCTTSLRYALTTSSRALMLNPEMSQSDLQAMVRAKLAHADPNVTVTLTVDSAAGGKIATVRGSYDRSILLPLLPSIPIRYSTIVTTTLPTTLS